MSSNQKRQNQRVATMKISRRAFLGGIAAAGAVSLLPAEEAHAAVGGDTYATLIDLTQCDGCAGRETPACVTACRTANAHKFPEPDPAMLKDYWPQKKHEDWSDKRHQTDRLTPYNWLFVQKVTVDMGGTPTEAHIPRRCMHCDNPPCVKLCPFGAKNKTLEGPVYINEALCMGGAKCRDVCPWNVPQRQAGVGPYTKIDPVPAGGGVMYKCDLCRDRLAEGGLPACVEACPRGAMHIGTRNEIVALAEELRQRYNGEIYGDTQNGGTSTFYVSAIPFHTIDAAIRAKAEKPAQAMRMHNPRSIMQANTGWQTAVLAAPFVGALGAFAALSAKKNEQKNQQQEETPHEESQS